MEMLVGAAATLQNCLRDYRMNVLFGNSLIYLFLKNGISVAAVEINKTTKKVLQAYGKKNTQIEEDDELAQVFNAWAVAQKLITDSKNPESL